jgi:hypothetical protein
MRRGLGRETKGLRFLLRGGARLCLFFVAAAASSQYYFEIPAYKPWEFGVYFGGGLSLVRGLTTYRDGWSGGDLISVLEETTIEAKAKPGEAGGVFATYFFKPGVGLQLNLGYSSAPVPTTADFLYRWTWSNRSSNEKNAAWHDTGRLRMMPLSLDLLGKKKIGRNEISYSGGITLLINRFRTESSFGFGVSTFAAGRQYIDAFRVGLRIRDTTWKALGGNVGFGLRAFISERFRLLIDARFLWVQKKSFSWDMILGTSEGIFFDEVPFAPFGEEDAERLRNNNKISPLEVNPSSVQFTVGFIVLLGSRIY